MEITIETIEANKKQYNQNIEKITAERAELMRKVSELRRKRETLTDEIAVAESEFEESQLVQQINDLTAVYKSNKLTLEQIGLQQDRLGEKIDKRAYSDGIVANRKAKADLAKEQELMYCENEVAKCSKALKLYTLKGDTENIGKWQRALSEAQKSLEYAQVEMGKEGTETSPKREVETTEDVPKPQAGYSIVQNGNQYVEKQQQVLKDYSGKEMGSRTITWTSHLETGSEDIEVIGAIENNDGKYSIKESTRSIGGELEQQRKEMTCDSKITGDKEQIVFQRDAKGNENYFRRVNGKLTFRITKSIRGITIENYSEGQLVDSYEYDENGKAIEGMGMADIEQLDENYVENFFDGQVPYFEAENRTILESAVEATEKVTRTGVINQGAQDIKRRQQERMESPDKKRPESDKEI